MELRQLRYFLKVAETKSFTKAAEKLHIAQQPLSFQIKRLEEELGVKLFNRTTRSVVLTPDGEKLRTEFQAGLGKIDRGVELAHRIASGEEGIIYIGYNPPTLYSVMPIIIRKFRNRYPKVEVVLLEMAPPALERHLLIEEIDIGILSTISPKTPGLDNVVIYREPAAVAIQKKHPLTKNSQIALGELNQEPFVMYSRQVHPELFDVIIALCRSKGFSPNIVQEAATESALIGLVAVGLGVALVPSNLSRIRTDEVVYLPLVNPSVTIDVAMVWKKGKSLPWLTDLRHIANEVSRSYRRKELQKIKRIIAK